MSMEIDIHFKRLIQPILFTLRGSRIYIEYHGISHIGHNQKPRTNTTKAIGKGLMREAGCEMKHTQKMATNNKEKALKAIYSLQL